MTIIALALESSKYTYVNSCNNKADFFRKFYKYIFYTYKIFIDQSAFKII